MSDPKSDPKSQTPDSHGKPVSHGHTAPSPADLLARPASGEQAGGGSLWWLWLVVLAVAGGAGYYYYPKLMGAKTGDAPAARGGGSVPVVSATARKGDMKIFLTGLGTVTAFNSVTVRSRVDGELMKVNFTEGQLVKQGDLLAEIDPRPFQVQLMQAQGQHDKDLADNKNAKINLERYRSAKDAISDQVIDTQAATVTQTDGALKIDDANIENANLQLTYCHIVSPITGRIGLRLVDLGNIVHASDPTPLAVINQLQPICAVFPIAEDDLDKVIHMPDHGKGLPILLYDRELKKILATGTLLTVDNQVDPTTGTVKFKGVFPNEDEALFPNQFVNARLLVDTKKDTVIIPAAAVQRSPTATFVYVVKSDAVAMRTITIGPSEGDDVAVETGLQPGEVVVVEGVDKLTDGAKVTAKAAGASKTKSGGKADGDPEKPAKPEKPEKPEGKVQH
jgi:multidrug efflux system membrane fusion protein